MKKSPPGPRVALPVNLNLPGSPFAGGRPGPAQPAHCSAWPTGCPAAVHPSPRLLPRRTISRKFLGHSGKRLCFSDPFVNRHLQQNAFPFALLFFIIAAGRAFSVIFSTSSRHLRHSPGKRLPRPARRVASGPRGLRSDAAHTERGEIPPTPISEFDLGVNATLLRAVAWGSEPGGRPGTPAVSGPGFGQEVLYCRLLLRAGC